MKKKDVTEVMEWLAEFGEKFPLLAVNQINFYALAQTTNHHPKDFLSVVVLLDCMKQMNATTQKELTYYLQLEDVQKIQIRKNQQKWTFDIYKNKKEKIRLQHTYTHEFA